MKTSVVIVVLLMVTSAAQAQGVWRCGPDGRNFSDTPCRDGRELSVPQARPAADLDHAQDVARREKALADQLMRERQQRESQALAGAAGIDGSRLVKAPQARQPKAKPQRRLGAPDTWPAAETSSRRMKG